MLSLVFCWHFHQPDYRDADGRYQLPWAYLHAMKDYADMAAHLEAAPNMHCVVNFVPTLVEQLDDYARQFAQGELYIFSFDVVNPSKPQDAAMVSIGVRDSEGKIVMPMFPMDVPSTFEDGGVLEASGFLDPMRVVNIGFSEKMISQSNYFAGGLNTLTMSFQSTLQVCVVFCFVRGHTKTHINTRMHLDVFICVDDIDTCYIILYVYIHILYVVSICSHARAQRTCR
jgi:hypothetical protein